MLSNFKLSVLACLAFLAFSCESGCVEPIDFEATPEIATSGPGIPIHRPLNPCGNYSFNSIKDLGGNVVGNAELVNDNDYFYMINHLNHGWVFTKMRVYIGKHTLAPRNGQGKLAIEEFNYPLFLGRPANENSVRIPISKMGNCSDIIVWATISELDWFGNILESKEVWFDGTSLMNGKYFSFCKNTCIPTPIPVSH